MEARSVAKNVRISADKARLIMDLIRGKSANEGMAILRNTKNKASALIKDVLASAIANALNNLKLDKDKLYITKCHIDGGKLLKRIMFDSRGHVGRKDHRSCHITVIVAEKQ